MQSIKQKHLITHSLQGINTEWPSGENSSFPVMSSCSAEFVTFSCSQSADSQWITRKLNATKISPSMNRLWPSGSDKQAPPSPKAVEWDLWRQKSVRRNWCGHQVEDPLTARLASAPFDCWCTSIRCHASARQFYFSSLLKVFSSD